MQRVQLAPDGLRELTQVKALRGGAAHPAHALAVVRCCYKCVAGQSIQADAHNATSLII